MGVNRGISIYKILENTGQDLTNVDFYNVKLSNQDLTSVILPKNKNLFQVIYKKSLNGTILPEGDYSIYDFQDVDIRNIFFPRNSKLPKDRDLFLNVYKKNLYNSTLPEGDYSEYSFNNVDIEKINFTLNSKLPLNPYFFKELRKSSLKGAKLPVLNYSKYVFDGVDLRFACFPNGSILPREYDFLSKLFNIYSGYTYFEMPKNFKSFIHMYNLEDSKLKFKECDISKYQTVILNEKSKLNSKRLNKKTKPFKNYFT